MMGRTDGQIRMIVLDLSELIPANHLLRKIEAIADISHDIRTPLSGRGVSPACGK